jgi:hypothetical protein
MEKIILVLYLIQCGYTFYWFRKYQKIIERQAHEIVDLRTTNNALTNIIKNGGMK